MKHIHLERQEKEKGKTLRDKLMLVLLTQLKDWNTKRNMKEKILVKIVVETDVSLGQHQLDVWLAEVLERQYIGKVPSLCTCNVQDAMVLD